MAESFKNYNTSISNTNTSGVIVIPPAISVPDTSEIRESGSVAQIHSIYISQISAGTLKKRSGYIDGIKNI